MTSSTPIERVKAMLSAAGYRPVPMPLQIGSMPFEFDAALLGPERAPDLVIVIDTIEEKEARVRQKLVALSRALDVIGSRRPLTAILAGPRPPASTIDVIGRVCRVLSVGTPVGNAGEAALRDALAVLLPLRLPVPSDAVADPIGELSRQIPPDTDATVREAILSHAPQGAESVEQALKKLLEQSLPKQPEAR